MKKLPALMSDAEVEDFVANSDLTEYDLSGMVQMRFELKPKDKSVNLAAAEMSDRSRMPKGPRL